MPRFESMLTAIKHVYETRRLVLGIAVTVLLALIVWNATAGRRRIWTPAETPVAFWSWRLETPSEEDVNLAVRETGAKTLFLRAGQVDYEAGRLNRIRRVTGPIPGNITVHFVYNATRSFLKEFERISDAAAASAVLAAFAEDLDRALGDQALVVGLQLDFDVPTRLLPNYSSILKNIRARLPKDKQLSITGLPTWLNSPALLETLTACDFWVPQFYGARIPERLDDRIPITTSELVARSISRTRDLGRPFYAGLAAYGYVIHYSNAGDLIGLRGDLDPLLVVGSPDFELTSQMSLFLTADTNDEKKAGEWRCAYRARRNVIVDGTAVRAGESLVLDRPTAAGLRACAREARENAGTGLLGICVFRIPSKGDSTTLTMREIAFALRDTGPRFSLEARVNQLTREKSDEPNVRFVLELENNGTAASRAGEGALTVVVRVPPGSLESVSSNQYALVEPMFESDGAVVRCAMKRANAVKLSVVWWPPGAKLTTILETKRVLHEVNLRYAATLDDGSALEAGRTLAIARMQ